MYLCLLVGANHTQWDVFFRPGLHGVPMYPLQTIKEYDNRISMRGLPLAIDWRYTFGPVRNQGQCGSCWAFAGVGVLESALARKHPNRLYDLSEQQMMDCSRMGCRGATLTSTLMYLRRYALCPESMRPYVARENRNARICRSLHRLNAFPRVKRVQTFLGELALQKALEDGPLIVAIHANAGMYAYTNGIFDAPCTGVINHAVILVGYNQTEEGVPYWWIRNSWGTHWGEQGYFRMIRGRFHCSIGRARSYQIGI